MAFPAIERRAGRAAPRLLRAWSALALLPAAFAAAAPATAADGQPIRFSHRIHADKASLQCVDCHSGADVGDQASIPSIRKCMLCHERVGADLPEVARLAEYWQKNREVPWIRVYSFEAKAAVIFRHAPHYRAGVECAVCHGDVAAMTDAKRAVEHTMGTCVACHRQTKASDDCLACHY